ADVEFSQPWRAARDAKANVFHVVDLIDDGHKDQAAEYLANLLAEHEDVHDEVRRLLAQHYGTETPEV
ncbi:MAG: hypothetical protein ABIQ18_47750, partial [Umezawaea sp.]